MIEPYDASGVQRSPEEMAEQILDFLVAQGYLRDPRLNLPSAQRAVREARQRQQNGNGAARRDDGVAGNIVAH